MNLSFRAKQIAAFAAVYLIWGSTFLGIRYAIETLPGFTMASLRFLVAGLIFFAWSRYEGAAWPTLRQWRSSLWIGALLLLLGNGAVVWAEHSVSTGLTALLVATEPVWVAVLLWMKGERPRLRTVAGVLVGFAGAALLAAPGMASSAAEEIPVVAVLVVMIGSLAWAAGSVYVRDADVPRSITQAAGLQMICGGVLLAIAGAASGELSQFDWSQGSARSWWALAYLMVFGSLIGFTAYSWLLRTTAPTLVATYAFVNPMVAVFLGWWIAGEPVGSKTLTAALLVVVSVVLVSGGGSAPKPSPADSSTSPLAEEAVH